MSNVNSGMADRRGRSRSHRYCHRQARSEVTDRGLGWRVLAVAFLLNVVWEMIQMFAYANMPARFFGSLAACSMAALGDGLYAVAVYWVGRLVTRDARWVAHLNARRTAVILVCGLGFAVIIERIAVFHRLWRYGQHMPTLPLGVGLWPVLQSMILPLVTFRIVSDLHRGMSSK